MDIDIVTASMFVAVIDLLAIALVIYSTPGATTNEHL